MTGAAGFIGSNLVKTIFARVCDAQVVGIDNMNDYYDPALKEERLSELERYEGFTFVKGNIADRKLIDETFASFKPEIVVNLAAQAGVRYSITNPDAYRPSAAEYIFWRSGLLPTQSIFGSLGLFKSRVKSSPVITQ